MQAFRRSRAGGGLQGQQVGDCVSGGKKFKARSVNDFRCQRTTASHVNGLGAVMRFLSAGLAVGARLSAAEVFGARQLVAGVIDNFVGALGWSVGTELSNLPRKNHDNED